VLLLLGRENAVKELLGVVGQEARELVQPLEAAVQADDRVRSDRDVQVGRAESDHRLEQVVDRVCRRSRFGARTIHWGSLRPVLSAEKRLI